MSTEVAALGAMLEESGALRRGHFLLSSGLHSPAYVQCALLLEVPARARRVGEELAALLAPFRPDSVLSPALGGLIVGHETAAALGVPFRFTERQGEAMALRRGFELAAGERVVVVEDVITTGRSTRETIAVAEARGARPVAVGAIIDRSLGRHGFPVPLVALTTLDLPTYPPDTCPLCAAGGTAEKPGSRPGR
ncbi:MAG TPA: orotate phosphoribosyltransferase [Thermoanaerobaculia bacterium]|nr:orotate phosphoribosyltransferase [Thermoanaerobaculia bacterium]